MKKTIKNILLLGLVIIETLILINVSSFALCYSSKTDGEEIHQRSCVDAFQATGLLTVFFEDGGLNQMGTATLIAPDVLITAAHILVGSGRRQVRGILFQPQCNPPSTFTIDMLQRPKNIWIHPDYDHDRKSFKHDIALIQLAQPVKHVRPAQLQKKLPDGFVSAQTTVVGYGRYGNNYEGPIFNDCKRRAGHMELFSDCCITSFLYTPYTPPYKNVNEKGFIDTHASSKYAAITTNGDNGGPAFIHINDEPSARILGIISKEFKKYTNNGICVSIFISIPYHYPWIESKLKLCNYHESDDESTIDYNNNPINSGSEYKDNQVEIAKEGLWSADKQGSEALQSLYEYALSLGCKQALEDIFSTASGVGSQMLDEFIALHKELFFE